MAKFDMLDPDEQALVRKPRPIGWFAAGIIFIAAIGFVLGVYLPLSQAHDTLLSTHEVLAKKSSELDQALRKKSETLDDTETKRADLASFVDKARENEKSLATRVEQSSATASSQLSAYLKTKHVSLETTKEDVRVTIDQVILFRPGGTDVTPQAKRPLCGVAKAIGQEKEWLLTVKARAPLDDKKYWETASARAGSLAAELETKCGVSAAQLSAIAERPAEGSDLNSKIDFIVGPRIPLRLRIEDAPLQ